MKSKIIASILVVALSLGAALNVAAQTWGSSTTTPSKPTADHGFGSQIGIGNDQTVALNLGGTGFPRINIGFGALDYFSSNGLMTVQASELTLLLSASGALIPISGGQLLISAIVSNTGSLTGGVAGDDFSLTGSVDIDNDGVIDASGVLLSGEITSYNATDGQGGVLDMFFFGFMLTGGELFDEFGASNVSIRLSASISSFHGDYTDDFKAIYYDGYVIGSQAVCTGTIGDYLWEDTNGNGIQDATEAGINGVDVILVGSDNVPQIITTQTGGPNNLPGYYQFSMLCAGDYTVSVDLGSVPPGYEPTLINAPGSNPDNDSNDPVGTIVTLPTDDSSDQTIDFGFELLLASLGDYVFLDLNEDGFQDAGETGVPGVVVNLLDCAGVQIDSTTTDNSGFYEFTDLLPGCYLVEFELPNGFVFSPQFAAATDQDSNADPVSGVSEPVQLQAGDDNPTIDAGIYQPATSSLGDFVWEDLNMNGIQDPNEPGIENVMVNLLSCDGTVLATTQTDMDGMYLFDDLIAGCYQVQFILPADYIFSPANVGDDADDSDADAATGLSPQIDLGTNSSDLTIDAGVFIPPTSSIGDFFWLDTNANGIQDPGETGIPGVEVTLLNCNGDFVATDTTDSNGMYLFDNLDPGCYNVVFNAPANCMLSPANAGMNDAADSDADPATGITGDVTIAAGDSDLTVDAGCYFTAGLGDYVWMDANQNGIQDAGEDPVPGVLVELLDEQMNPTGSTTFTDQDGAYSFTDLAPGSYFVQFTAPAGLVFTLDNVGDVALDSNANGTGKTEIIVLNSGDFDPTIDAGLYLPQEPMIDVEKATNGFDADDPTGPLVVVGGTVEWTYVVTNIGNVPLSNIVLIDDQIGAITCPFSSLEIDGAGTSSMTCTATGVAELGQYANLATVTGVSPLGADVTAMDPSHYFGVTPSIDIEKATNTEDADDPTGPLVPVGSTVNWTYVVTNTGNSLLTDVTVIDSDPGVSVVCPMNTLEPLPGVNTMTCSASGTAILGQYSNNSTVTGTPPAGPNVTDQDPSHYFGVNASIAIEKLTNGVDADDPNGGDLPQIEPGDSIVWTYNVTNTGNVELIDIVVTDNRGVAVTCPMDTLGAGDTMPCEGTGVALDVNDPINENTVPGLCGINPGPVYSNIGMVVGTTAGGMNVDAEDPSHYCNPNVCDVSVDATCLISVPVSSDYVCDKPIDTLTFIWDGSQNIRIKAYKGGIDQQLLADIDDIVPGQEVTVSGFAGSPNDVYYEIFDAGTSNKIGESNFHLSCSDSAMNGPEDCGGNVGNGKNDEVDLINDWLLEGIIDAGGVLDCTSSPVGGLDSCSFLTFPVSCETIDNVDDMTFTYTGGSCADSQNTQGSKFECSGQLNASLPALVVLDSGDSFLVQPGEAFVVPESGSGTEFSLSNAGGAMSLNVHTSCSAPLNTGDIFGAVTLQQINNIGSGSDVIYGYTITNNGSNDLISLTAIDDPLGPVPGLPSFLGAGQSVTLFNSVFVDMSVVNTVVVDAVDSTGAACSAVDSVPVSILPPPPCAVAGEGVLDIDHDKVKWKITNEGSSTATLDSLMLSWPQAIHSELLEIKIDGEKIYDIDTVGDSITLTAADFIGNPDKRRLSPGDEVTLEIKFEGHNHGEFGADAYGITLGFEQGCSVTFENTGLPFVCTKPISELSMIWDGAADPIQVKAWKGQVGSELLLDRSGINPGDRVTVSGYAGSPNDVFWEVFSGGTKLGESNFHMSCSDSEMGGAEDCGKRQGNGKGDNSTFINEWLLDGMIDYDGPFDCQ